MGCFTGKFQSAKQQWTTPQNLFDRLNSEFHFTVDLAASTENTKCPVYFTEEDDALQQEWKGVCWLNPPYGAKKPTLGDWVRKAWEEANKPGCKVVMLIPARTNTCWWRDYCMRAEEVRFVCGRPKFGDAPHGLPQPLALVIFSQSGGHPVLASYPA